MLSGLAAIDYLSSVAHKEDHCESSHWRKYHADFKFTGESFKGLQGFGGCEKTYSGLKAFLVPFLQRRFRTLATESNSFSTLDILAKNITATQGRAYDLDVLRQVLTLSFLHEKIPEVFTANNAVCVIGDGFASMTSLLLGSRSTDRVILVNLTKTLLVDLWFLKLWLGSDKFDQSVCLVTDEESLDDAIGQKDNNNSRHRVLAIQASNHQLIQKIPFNIVFNIASMQEMEPSMVEEYFQDLRMVASTQKLFFYCCNRQEKTLPDCIKSKFSEYPWQANDKILVDELCPWHQQFYSFKPPFFHHYDGPHKHRLTVLGPR